MKTLVYFLSNRCSYTRSKVLLKELSYEFDLKIIATGQLLTSDHMMRELETTYETFHIECGENDGTLTGMCNVSRKIAKESQLLLEAIMPDAVVVWADRFELLPFATMAAYLNIPVIQIQAGEISGNIDDKVRNAVSALADIHFVSHKPAYERISQLYPNVYNTGCPSLDLIKREGICRNNSIVTELRHAIVIFHPDTDEWAEAGKQVVQLFHEVEQHIGKHYSKVYWFQPNNDAGHLHVHSALKDRVELIKNLEGVEFLRLLADAEVIIGNSSAGIREASFLGVPCLLFGDRQKGRVTGGNIITDLQYKHYIRPCNTFGDGESSKRMVTILKGLLQ